MFKQRDTTTNSAWHSPGKGSLGSRGQTIFICPLGGFCCTLMTTKDSTHLYSLQFLPIQGSEKVRPITGYRCVMALHMPFFPCKPSCRHAAWGTAHQATCHVSKDAFCTPGPRVGKRQWHCATTWGTGGDLKYASADSQESAWCVGHGIPDHHGLLHHHLGMMDVKYHWRIS